MKRKYFSALLMGALTIASVSTFTSCKDYDDDIKSLQEQIDKSGSTVGDLQTQLTTLKSAAEAAQAAADAAKNVKVMKFSKNGRLVIQKGNTIYNVAGLKLN